MRCHYIVHWFLLERIPNYQAIVIGTGRKQLPIRRPFQAIYTANVTFQFGFNVQILHELWSSFQTILHHRFNIVIRPIILNENNIARGPGRPTVMLVYFGHFNATADTGAA